MFKRIQLRYKQFQPAAVGDTETKALFTVKKGERVIFASARADIAAAADSQTTYTLGDGDGTDSYIGAIDTETFTAGSVIDGEGAYLSNSGGKLYTADDTIDVVYTVTTAGATNPMVTFCIGTVRDW